MTEESSNKDRLNLLRRHVQPYGVVYPVGRWAKVLHEDGCCNERVARIYIATAVKQFVAIVYHVLRGDGINHELAVVDAIYGAQDIGVIRIAGKIIDKECRWRGCCRKVGYVMRGISVEAC